MSMITVADAVTKRNLVVTEARSWIGTPYETNQMCKGAGVDCARLLVAVYRACGLVPEEEIGIFSGDWFNHATEDVYMHRIVRHAYKIVEAVAVRSLDPIWVNRALPGNILLARVNGSRIYNHGGIVTSWPWAVHAMRGGVREVEVPRDLLWADAIITVFDIFGGVKGDTCIVEPRPDIAGPGSAKHFHPGFDVGRIELTIHAAAVSRVDPIILPLRIAL